MLNPRIIIVTLSVLLLLGVSLLSSAEITEDMIAAAWLFEGDAEDMSGNGFDGEVEGSKFVAENSGTRSNLMAQATGSKSRNGSAHLKKLPSHIGSNLLDEREHGGFSSTLTVGKLETSTIRCTRITKWNSLFTVTRVGTTLLRTIC